jgi:hypothetical protein
MQPALHGHLMERIVSAPHIRRACQRVKANHGAPGSDGMNGTNKKDEPQLVLF